MFNTTPDDLDMHVIYDVSHNIAKVEEHMVDGKQKTLLVHRKGSTRAFPPHHPLIAVDYQVNTTLIMCVCLEHVLKPGIYAYVIHGKYVGLMLFVRDAGDVVNQDSFVCPFVSS